MGKDARIARATFRLPESDIETLKASAAHDGTTVGAALRKAIALERFCREEVRQGGRILVERADGVIREIVLF